VEFSSGESLRGRHRCPLTTTERILLIETAATPCVRDARGRRFDWNLMLLLDGCGTCAPLRELSNLVSTGRAARIQILSVWQSLGQLQGGTGERPRRPC